VSSFWTTVVAGYAAGVSTIVGLRQILVDMPRVLVSHYEPSLFQGGQKVGDLHSVEVINAGRRPITIVQVAFLAPAAFMHLPGDWVHAGEVPFILHEGQYRTLVLRKDQLQREIPAGAIWVAKDSVGRWWPRKFRLRVRVRTIRNRLRPFHERPGSD